MQLLGLVLAIVVAVVVSIVGTVVLMTRDNYRPVAFDPRKRR